MFSKLAKLALALVVTLSAGGQALAASPNTVRGFVYEWFGLFDENAPTEAFLSRLAPTDVQVDFPEQRLSSHADFAAWYQGILGTFEHATHDIKTLAVAEQGDIWLVELTVDWNATTFAGEHVGGLFLQLWEVQETEEGALLIKRNQISPAP